jgi:hypothetical protein
MPEAILMELGMHIMTSEAISADHFINPPINNTNTAASQLYCFTDFITLPLTSVGIPVTVQTK